MPPPIENLDDAERRLEELKEQNVREAIGEIRRDMRVVRKRQHGMANDIQGLIVKVAVIESRAAAWGAAGAAVVTLLGLLAQWMHK